MNTDDRNDSKAVKVLTELLRDAVRPASPAELDQGLAELRRRVDKEPRRRRFARAWVWAAAACTGLALWAVLELSGSDPDASAVLVERVEGGQLLDNGYLSESGNGGVTLSFNEGSKVALEPGARGRLRELTAQGAHLAVEHGSANFEITQHPEHRWSVEAGPFLVTVKGTQFSVFWDPASEQFAVELRHGRVSVAGPVVGEALSLRAGQKLSVSLPKAQSVISEERPALEPPVVNSAAPSESGESIAAAPSASVPAPAAPASTDSARTGSNPAGERRWKQALASGQWDEILADVERAGVENTLNSASSEDLFALADAARYRRKLDLARAALLAQRRRFPGSARALDAVFLLARVEEQRPSGKTQAIQRYDEYLARAPSGTYAAEALGRKMILTNEVVGRAAARRLARQYLERYPEGSHAAAARALEGAP